ncbi:microtubule interacting and transport domain-containing protein (MIT) [Tieghemostelium lacteum]|uniref:Microtubule interacting and transport domain-containing protein (MIT) n=1 Tax=Tieghemostelium lacteum TaxID=361077 RepID=A0A151Z3X4_TIELA|nr:microtubule interacting and transport domain-containing protein (MIT) [Tieghemostelium lacteum]|eukprot:KYQ88666.1 microtubule interacting and transport domain-containing protein (MIT) [Tieghemostelium lacteum]
MGDTTNLLKQSYTLIQQAALNDRSGNWSEALRLYLTGIEGFISALKIEKNERVKMTLKLKMNEYLNRCEQLKELQKQQQQLPSCNTCITSPTSPTSLLPPMPVKLSPNTSLQFPTPPSQLPINDNISSSHNSSNLDLLLPSVPTFDPRPSAPIVTPYVPNPTKSTESGGTGKITLVKSLKIKNGSTGCSYEQLFGEYLIGASAIKIDDPYIRTKHQCDNFIKFCELVVKKNCTYNEQQRSHTYKPIFITLSTSFDSPTQEDELKLLFKQMKEDFVPFNVTFNFQFSKTLHDRVIEVSNGYKIKLGRGLDFYQKPSSKYCIGSHDDNFRATLETSVDIFKGD